MSEDAASRFRKRCGRAASLPRRAQRMLAFEAAAKSGTDADIGAAWQRLTAEERAEYQDAMNMTPRTRHGGRQG